MPHELSHSRGRRCLRQVSGSRDQLNGLCIRAGGCCRRRSGKALRSPRSTSADGSLALFVQGQLRARASRSWRRSGSETRNAAAYERSSLRRRPENRGAARSRRTKRNGRAKRRDAAINPRPQKASPLDCRASEGGGTMACGADAAPPRPKSPALPGPPSGLCCAINRRGRL